MAATATDSSKRVLEPIERVSEILFGVIMVLTFLVFCSTLPVVIPFVVFHDPLRALRISNAIAIVLLFSRDTCSAARSDETPG